MSREKLKVYQSGRYWGSGETFIKNSVLVPNIEDADIVIFPGGADINPEIYGKKAHPTTYFSVNRDSYEISDFSRVRENQVVLGICRGAQLVCALFGGILVQNCNNHCGCDHTITSADNRSIYRITSIHHQMMYPFDLPEEDYEILYTSTNRLSSVYEGDGVDPEVIKEKGEPEIILFHRQGLPKCLAVQGHPEMMAGSPVSDMISDLLTSYVYENKKGE